MGQNQCYSTGVKTRVSVVLSPWILSKDVVLAVQYKVYLVKRVISLVDTVQYIHHGISHLDIVNVNNACRLTHRDSYSCTGKDNPVSKRVWLSHGNLVCINDLLLEDNQGFGHVLFWTLFRTFSPHIFTTICIWYELY